VRDGLGLFTKAPELGAPRGYFCGLLNRLKGLLAPTVGHEKPCRFLEFLKAADAFVYLEIKTGQNPVCDCAFLVALQEMLTGFDGGVKLSVVTIEVDDPFELLNSRIRPPEAREQESQLFAGLHCARLEHDQEIVDGKCLFELAANGVAFGRPQVLFVGFVFPFQFQIEGGEFAAADFIAGILGAGLLEEGEGLSGASLVNQHLAAKYEVFGCTGVGHQLLRSLGDGALIIQGQQLDEEAPVVGGTPGVLALEGLLGGVENQALAGHVLVNGAMNPDQVAFAVDRPGEEAHPLEGLHRIQGGVEFKIFFGEFELLRHKGRAPGRPLIAVSLLSNGKAEGGQDFSPAKRGFSRKDRGAGCRRPAGELAQAG